MVCEQGKLMSETQDNHRLLDLTTQIIAAHVSHNTVSNENLVSLIRDVYQSLSTAGTPDPEPVDVPEPAVNPKKSVFPDYIICLEDGKKMKMLRRHLKTAYDLTPEQYRERWGLALDYPMVSPNYAQRRSLLAKSIGLGTKPAPAPAQPTAAEPKSRKRKSA